MAGCAEVTALSPPGYWIGNLWSIMQEVQRNPTETMRGALVAQLFVADRFVLYSARDGSGGGPYVVEAAYPLG